MAEAAQERALRNYRKRLTERGMVRFEVQALDTDRNLIRAIAKRLAQDDEAARALRDTVRRSMDDREQGQSRILDALLRSPLRGSGIKFRRARTPGRKIDL